MTIKNEIQQLLIKSLQALGLEYSGEIEISYPTAKKFGDYASNIAMVLAKQEKTEPMKLAEKIKEALLTDQELKKLVSEVSIAQPGFINFYLSDQYLQKQVKEIIKQGPKFGQQKSGQGKKIQIEFVSANPTGPLTIGNARGGFYGDVLANVYQALGYQVVKEYLINDSGNQIKTLGHSILKDDEQQYKGKYIDQLNKEIDLKQDVFAIGQQGAKKILDEYIKDTIENKMKIKFDVWFSKHKELCQTGEIKKIIDKITEQGETYEDEGAVWFRSEKYGDTRDRVVIKSDGDYTYLATDFAYAENKFGKRKFDKCIYVWGADHLGDVPGLLNAIKVLGYEGRGEIILQQFITLMKDGQEVKMSKRAGTYITMSELIDQVGHDVARFIFLMYSPSSHINFDLDLAKEKSEKNPVYYVQYAYVRANNILDKAKNMSQEKTGYLENELAIVKILLQWPEILDEVVASKQVNHVTAYAISLADEFHRYYQQYRIIDNDLVNPNRLVVISAYRIILKNVLDLLKISSPEKM